MINALGKHAGEEQHIIADVFAHLALAIERGRWPIDRIGFQQHFSNVIQPAALGIANFEQLFGLAELSEDITDVVLHLRITQTNITLKVVMNELGEEFLQRMRFFDHVLCPLQARTTRCDANM